MNDDARLLAELTETLASLRLVEARGSSSETAQEQLDALLARLEATTTVLRRHPPGTVSQEAYASRSRAKRNVTHLGAKQFTASFPDYFNRCLNRVQHFKKYEFASLPAGRQGRSPKQSNSEIGKS